MPLNDDDDDDDDDCAQARLKEMTAMRAARESNMEDEEMWNRQKNKSDEAKRQRELEIDMMRHAR